MSVNFIARAPEVAGVYLTNAHVVAPRDKGVTYWLPQDARYMPLLNLVELKAQGELRWVDTEQTGEDLVTYQKNKMFFNNAPKPSCRIDVSASDLLIGGVRMVLNFMDVPLTVKTRTDIPKLFPALAEAPLLSDYKGKVVVLSFHSFNTPTMIKETSGLVNYFDALRSEKLERGESNTSSFRMLDRLSQCWKDFKPEALTQGSNAVKVALVHIYSKADFLVHGREYEDMYCAESGLFFRRTDKVLGTSTHPKLSDSLVANKQIVHAMRDNGVSCFIVDNDKSLDARFINFAGQIRQIPQIVDKNRPQGLYITSVNGDKGLETDSFVPLEKIDESPYIYKSQEEARHGSDIRAQTEQAHELSKLELGIEATRLKHQYDEQVRKMDLQAKQRQLEYDERTRVMEAKYQEALRNMQVSLEERKRDTQQDKYRYDIMGMENKHRYESFKYERDSTIEGLKTAGSIAGLLAGGYVLFKQLSKA